MSASPARISCFVKAASEYEALIPKVSFPSVSKKVDEYDFTGIQCEIAGTEYYHHTSSLAFQDICEEGVLRPSTDPLSDGTVNFTLNPNFHRFGSVRLVLDRERVDKAAHITPMVYVTDEFQQRELNHLVDLRQSTFSDHGRNIGRNRIEQDIGVEPQTYLNECKRFTKDPVPLTTVKEVEYWVPWHYGNDSSGCNVFPQYSDFTGWATGVPQALAMMQTEVRMAKDCASALGVPFSVKSCYPFMVVDRDEHGRNMIPLTPAVLRGIGDGKTPEPSEFFVSSTSGECCCPPEELPKTPLPSGKRITFERVLEGHAYG